jgi:hypothetical protein
MCLTQALLHGRLSNDSCLRQETDHASRAGHLYSDKAPGLSLLELPSFAVLQPLPLRGTDFRLWVIRALSVGLALLGCAFLVGRVAEGLAPGFGGIALVAFALGTIAGAVAQISFEHLPAALALFGAFLLAWSRRPFLAGLAGGAALLIEYESGLGIALIGLYVLVLRPKDVWRYAVGVLPGAALLGAYDWAAFGAPWHLSYRYVSAAFRAQQGSGFFGIGLPTPSATFAVLSGNGGLLVVSPVLVLAAYGLWRLRRRYPLEALAAAVVALSLVLVNSGYFLPYGGTSPGPRFLVPALPFLALGLGPGLAWRPRLGVALAVLSVATSTAIALVWADGAVVMRQTVWGELARLPVALGSSPYVHALTPNLVNTLVSGRGYGVLVVVLAAAGALALAARAIPWRIASPAASGTSRGRVVLAAALVVLLLAAADVGAVLGYPYGNGYQPRKTPVMVSVTGKPSTSYTGGEVNFRLDAANYSSTYVLTDVVLTIDLSPGTTLVGLPKYTIGNGCRAGPAASYWLAKSQRVVCQLGYLSPGDRGTVWFGAQFSDAGDHFVTVHAASNGFSGPAPTVYRIPVGA